MIVTARQDYNCAKCDCPIKKGEKMVMQMVNGFSPRATCLECAGRSLKPPGGEKGEKEVIGHDEMV